ncbi:Flagellar hook-basal body complex protein FliE [Pigmentiphaga humi]|uniref:Flagellar hook-basal body complex protein FliE n=1 Tax=Pigmentiphaga humi TaxID=2478468 RepID=A0A3P4B1J8_9BURK|nr:flagellar hook-basal body complex protein FliE [Pigmentiphaga humi]VCU69932.1 Flagellar hook-basal body complex protein FliE [Pigmentiphaga humi]
MDRIQDVLASFPGQAQASGTGMARAAQMLSRPDALMGGTQAPASFANVLVDAIQGVQQAQTEASAMQRAYQQGDPETGLEATMIAMNKASLSFQMLAQARNRVVAAYNEVMNMQV